VIYAILGYLPPRQRSASPVRNVGRHVSRLVVPISVGALRLIAGVCGRGFLVGYGRYHTLGVFPAPLACFFQKPRSRGGACLCSCDPEQSGQPAALADSRLMELFHHCHGWRPWPLARPMLVFPGRDGVSA